MYIILMYDEHFKSIGKEKIQQQILLKLAVCKNNIYALLSIEGYVIV